MVEFYKLASRGLRYGELERNFLSASQISELWLISHDQCMLLFKNSSLVVSDLKLKTTEKDGFCLDFTVNFHSKNNITGVTATLKLKNAHVRNEAEIKKALIGSNFSLRFKIKNEEKAKFLMLEYW